MDRGATKVCLFPRKGQRLGQNEKGLKHLSSALEGRAEIRAAALLLTEASRARAERGPGGREHVGEGPWPMAVAEGSPRSSGGETQGVI